MPDGSLASRPKGSAKCQTSAPPSLEEIAATPLKAEYIHDPDQLATDMAYMAKMLPLNPHAFRVMASACRVISNGYPGNRLHRVSDLEEGLDNSALHLPVTTADDAVAILGIIAHEVERLEDFHLDAEALTETLGKMRLALEGALPFLAAQAHVEMAEIGCGSFTTADRERVRAVFCKARGLVDIAGSAAA